MIPAKSRKIAGAKMTDRKVLLICDAILVVNVLQ